MKKLTVVLLLFLAFPLVSHARKATISEPITVFVDSPQDFGTYIAAAFTKKGTPAMPVVDQGKAEYTLRATPVSVHQESGTSKMARCMFAWCAGIADTSSVSVELINNKTSGIEWSYNVHKQRGSGYNDQSMAEAIAKHLKNHLEGKGN